MNSSRILIRGGRVIDPANRIDQVADVLVDAGKISAVGACETTSDDHIIDASQQVVCPGLVDLRARLREPGLEQKATIASEALAANRGGITSLCCPPDTIPVIDTPAIVDLLKLRTAGTGRINLHPVGALTRALKGSQLAELAALRDAGCVGVGNTCRPLENTLVSRRALEYAATFGLTVHVHPEDPHLRNGGCVHEGVVSTRLGLPGIPAAAESIAVASYLQLAELCGANIHFCGMSHGNSIAMLKSAQRNGIRVSADVAIHQLFLTEHDISEFDPNCHVSPPFRTTTDRDVLRQSIADGVVSVICSDHQPHEKDAKNGPFAETEAGISGLETLLPLTLALVGENVIDLSSALACITVNPARILGLSSGTLTPGSSADICIFDPEAAWIMDPAGMASAGKNTPFGGREFVGQVTHTLFGGNIVYQSDTTGS